MAVTPFQLTEPFLMDSFNSRISEINTMFGGLGNEYVWEKYKENEGIPRFIQTERTGGWGDLSPSRTYYYADSYTIDSNGFQLVGSVSSFKPTSASNCDVLKGKYYSVYGTPNNLEEILYIPNSASFSYYGGNYRVSIQYHMQFPALEVPTESFGFLNGSNSDAYPPPDSDGYSYSFLGKLGSFAKVEVGSYVGTGTYGKNNPITLNFNVPVKLLFISGATISQDNYAPNPGFYILDIEGTRNLLKKQFEEVGSYQHFYIAGVNLNSIFVSKLTDHTVSWYETSSTPLLNSQGMTYNYIAIG